MGDKIKPIYGYRMNNKKVNMIRDYPQENVRCEWKLFKNLKNSF